MPIYKFNDLFYSELEYTGLSYIWRRANGGFSDFKASDFDEEGIEFFEGQSFNDFRAEQQSRKFLDDVLWDSLSHGWIDPRGNFYSCGYTNHTNLLEAICGSWETPEKEKWLKINREDWIPIGGSYITKITPAQKRTLLKIGRSPENPDYLDTDLKFEEVFPNGNRAMDKLRAKHQEIVRQEKAKRIPIKPTLDML